MKLKLSIIPCLLLILTACASLGLHTAQSLTERVGYAYGTHTAVLQATTSALDAKEITSQDAEHVLAIADQARQVLDAAKVAAGAGDISTAEGKLTMAVAILQELQNYLRAHK